MNGPAAPLPGKDRGSFAFARSATHAIPNWAGLALVLALWAVARPYRGIRHDAVLYVGQTLARLMPDVARDLFLVYGSQDRYSLFSSLMVPLVERIGLPDSQIVALLAGQGLFLCACWALTRDFPSAFLRWCAMVSVAVMVHTYGGLGQFSFSEAFLTARVLAEPFGLFALVWLMRGRLAAGLMCAAIGTLLHPLITLPVLVVGWLFLVDRDRRWLWLAAVVLVPAALGLAHVAPFEDLWHRYDPQWLAGVKQANEDAFIASMGPRDWTPALLDLWMLALAIPLLPRGPLARLLRVTLMGAALSMALWGIGADLLHDVLLTQLQVWRIYWIAHLLALLVFPLVLLRHWGLGPSGRWFAAALALATVAAGSNWNTGYLCLAWAAASWIVSRRRSAPARWIVILATIGSCLATVLVTGVVATTTMAAVEDNAFRIDHAGWAQIVLGLPLPGAICAGIVLFGMTRSRLIFRVTVIGLAALLVFGVSAWDQRSAWQRYLEGGLAETNLPFQGLIPAGASVYWDKGLLPVWLLLHRAEYLSREQASGLLFNRGTTLEYTRRNRVMAPLEAHRQICGLVLSLAKGRGADISGGCAPDIQLLADICKSPGGPGFMILQSGDPSGAIARWHYVDPGLHSSTDFNLYSCAALSAAPVTDSNAR